MAIDVNWLNDEQTLILWNVHGNWTLEEFYDAVTTTVDLSKDKTGTVDAIVDATNAGARPSGNLMGPFRHALTRCNLETVVYVRQRSGAMSRTAAPCRTEARLQIGVDPTRRARSRTNRAELRCPP